MRRGDPYSLLQPETSPSRNLLAAQVEADQRPSDHEIIECCLGLRPMTTAVQALIDSLVGQSAP